MSGIRYRDSEIRIRRGAEGAYRVAVDSPAGGAWPDFRLPFSGVELEEMLEAVADGLRRARGVPDARQCSGVATAAMDTPLHRFGQPLLSDLFSIAVFTGLCYTCKQSCDCYLSP